MFIWLSFTGLGTLVARFYKPPSITFYSFLILLIALWPVPQLILIRYLREAFFIHGVSFGFYQISVYIAATIFFYCLLVGFVLPNALEVLKNRHHDFTSGELYITDNIGDIVGGAIFSFVLVYLLNPFKILAVTSGLLILTSFLLLFSFRKHNLLLVSFVFVSVFYLAALNSRFEQSTLGSQYGDIVRYQESPFGRIIISKEGSQHTFWESGTPLYSDADIIGSEEKIHYPLSQVDTIENVLLVSGGLGETIGEIVKHNPKHIDYVELDPYLTGVAQSAGFLKANPILTLINQDARSYMKCTNKKYDSIIIDLPDPDTFQLNRFFTSEFFSIVKRILNRRGVLSFGMDYSQNYISGITKQKLSTVFNTLQSYFSNVIILPGEKAFFICGNGEIFTDIPERLRMKSVSTRYIEGFYYGNITNERIDWIRGNIDSEEYINTDFEPRMMNIVFNEWFSKYDSSPRPFVAVIFIIVLLYLVFMRKEEYILFSTGMAAMGAEMLIIFTFQVIYGYVYLKIGAIVTVFLIGLLPGAALGYLFREKKIKSLIISDIIILFLLIFYFIWIDFIRNEPHQAYFLIYCFLFSFFCGFQFPVATWMVGEKMSPAAGCLAADLAGASVGTLVVGTIMIPLWGIESAILFIIIIKISSSMIILFPGRRSLT